MGFGDAIRTCFGKYATFSGRAARPEFWWFFLFLMLGNIAAGTLDAMIFGLAGVETAAGNGSYSVRAQSDGPIALVFGLATLLPSLAVGWRRMHDTGRSGIYMLYPAIVMLGVFTFASVMGVSPMAGFDSGNGVLGLILILASIVLLLSPFIVLWWLTRPSQPGSNKYGPNPYEVTP